MGAIAKDVLLTLQDLLILPPVRFSFCIFLFNSNNLQHSAWVYEMRQQHHDKCHITNDRATFFMRLEKIERFCKVSAQKQQEYTCSCTRLPPSPLHTRQAVGRTLCSLISANLQILRAEGSIRSVFLAYSYQCSCAVSSSCSRLERYRYGRLQPPSCATDQLKHHLCSYSTTEVIELKCGREADKARSVIPVLYQQQCFNQYKHSKKKSARTSEYLVMW